MSSPGLIFAISVSIAFYGLFYGRFKSAGNLFTAVEAVIIGVTLSILLMLSGPFIRESISGFHSPLLEGFLLAAIPEKTGTILSLAYLTIGSKKSESVIQHSAIGMLIGAGFSFFENISYSSIFSPGIIYIRLLSSVPMHLTTSGLLGYFYGLYRLSSKPGRVNYLIYGWIISVVIHGFFDFSILSGKAMPVWVGPLIVAAVFIFEAAYSRAQTIPESIDLSNKGITLSEWFLWNRQRRYDKWIKQSAGTIQPDVAFFYFSRNPIRWSIVLVAAIYGLIHLTDAHTVTTRFFQLNLDEIILKSIFGVMPISFAAVIALIGSINPAYYQSKLLKIPVILNIDATLASGEKAKLVCYEMNRLSFFAKARSIDQKIRSVSFSYAARQSPEVEVETIELENEKLLLFRIQKKTDEFNRFYYRYSASRFLWGFFYNLRLPGFDSLKKFFVHPITLMQAERTYRAGDVIFQEGDRANHFFLIERGSVDFFKENGGKERIFLSNMGPGEIFGEMSLVSERPRSATAICREDCELSIARTDQLESLIRHNPEFTLKVIRMLVTRIIKSEETFKNELARLD